MRFRTPKKDDFKGSKEAAKAPFFHCVHDKTDLVNGVIIIVHKHCQKRCAFRAQLEVDVCCLIYSVRHAPSNIQQHERISKQF